MSLKRLFRLQMVVIITISMVLASCKGGKSGNTSQSATDSFNKEAISQDIKDVVYPLPAPYELTLKLNEIGAKFNASILNTTDSLDKYGAEKEKAVILGVYAADLGYCAVFDKKQEIQLYMQAVKTVKDNLGITVDYSNLLTDELKVKINNKDTLVNVITNTISDTYGFLYKNNNPDLAVMMVAGLWVESMYITTHISKESYNNTDIVKIVASQKDALYKLLEQLALRNSNADIKDLESKLEVLKPIYEKVEKGLTSSDYQIILKTIASVRKSFVS